MESIRQVRNRVMHFNPTGVSDENLRELRNFLGLLRRLGSVLLGAGWTEQPGTSMKTVGSLLEL
jgi:hypothetical protein